MYQRVEVQANSYTGSAQESAAVAQDERGRTVIVWQSRRQEADTYGVYAQRFDGWGRRLGGEVHVNTYAPDKQTQPAAAMDGWGRAWIVWESFGQDGDRGGIVGRLFDSSLSPLTPEFPVNSSGLGHQTDAALSVPPQGGAVVVWTSDEGAKVGRAVYARRYGAGGEARCDPLRVSEAVGVLDRVPSIGTYGDGSFVVVWWRTDPGDRSDGGGGSCIVGRRFDATGTPRGDEFAVSPPDGAVHLDPALAVDGSGAFCVVWATLEGEAYGLSMRRYGADGLAVSPVERIDTGGRGSVTGLAAAMRGDGQYVVSWSLYGQKGGAGRAGDALFARVYDASGAPVGDMFRVTAAVEGDQRLTPSTGAGRAVFADDGRITVAWSGDAGLGDGSAANATFLVPDGLYRKARERFASSGRLERSMGEPVGAAPHVPPTYDPEAPVVDRAAIADEEGGGGGDGFLGFTQTPWNPPDPHLAVGPERMVAIVNGGIAFFEKDGTLLFQDEIEDSFGFWGELGATHTAFDPEVLYDSYSGRFMAMANERAPGNRPKFLFAVSDDSDPMGVWHKYRWDVYSEVCEAPPCNSLIDSPNLATDAQAVYLSADFFSPSRYLIYIVEKGPLLTGGVPQTRSLVVPDVLSIGLAPSYDDPPAQYLIESALTGVQTQVRIRAVTDPLGSPQMHVATVIVPAYSQPEEPPSLGTTTRIETFDSRFWSCVVRNGSLWATHHVGSARVLQRWYQFRLNGWPVSGFPELVQWGQIDPGPGIRTYYGSIWADGSDNAALVFSRSSPTEFVSMARASRLASDPPGQMGPVEIIKVSTQPLSITGSDRWGDYSGVVTDPAAPGVFWGHGEYLATEWRTWIERFAVVDLAAPVIVSADPFDGYIDPRRESTDGATLDQGIDHLTVTFDETVLGAGGGALNASAFSVSVTGGVNPGVASIDASGNPTIAIQLGGVIPVGEYTTISADVADAAGNAGSVSVVYGFLPSDADQDGTVGPFDLLRFRQIVNGVYLPPQGSIEMFVDTDRDGSVGPFDLLAFRQLINGFGNATQAWAGQSLP